MIRFLVAGVAAAVIAVFFFSEKEPVLYDCATVSGEVFQIKHTGYRFWVGLWSEADGELTVAVPGGMIRFYSVETVDSLDEERLIGDARGALSRLTRKFFLVEKNGSELSGKCLPRP